MNIEYRCRGGYMKIALFFDIDGTLLDALENKVTEDTLEVLKYLKEFEEVDCYIATGRSKEATLFLKSYLNYFKGFVYTNGSEVEVDGKILYEEYLTKEAQEEVVQFANDNKISYGLIEQDVTNLCFFDEFAKKNFLDFLSMPYKTITNPLASYNYSSAWLFAPDKKLLNYPGIHSKLLSWGSYGADIVNPTMDKAKGIKVIRNNYNYDIIVSFGDAINDIGMFQQSDISFLVKRGESNLQKYATFKVDNIKIGLDKLKELKRKVDRNHQ